MRSRAYGKSTSRTKAIEPTVPSMSISATFAWKLVKLRERIGDFVAGEVCNPTIRIDEKAHGGELGIAPHIEPVLRSRGNADEIALHANRLIDAIANV